MEFENFERAKELEGKINFAKGAVRRLERILKEVSEDEGDYVSVSYSNEKIDIVKNIVSMELSTKIIDAQKTLGLLKAEFRGL